jgi:hypothetical protein
MTMFRVPKSVERLGHAPFHRCSQLERVELDAENKFFDVTDRCLWLHESPESDFEKGF